MTRRNRSRLLWVPYAQRGSVYPVAPLIEELVTRDVEILLLGPPSLAPLATSLRTDFQAYGAGIDYDWAQPHRRDRHGLGPQVGSGWLHQRVAAEYTVVERALSSFRPGAVLADSFVIGAGLAAEAHNARWASYVHYLFDETAHVDAMHRVWWEGPRRELDAYLAWWNELRGTVGLGPETRRSEDAPWYRMSPQRTFLLGHPLLRRGSARAPAHVTRTSFPPWNEEADRVSPVLSSNRARVLVANSSAWQDDADLLRAALEGMADSDIELVVTVAAEHELGIPTPPNATVHGYLPHSDILPAVDVVVSTAGYGIVSKALWWGRPLVLAPRARDQHYVADAVEDAGAGVRLGWPPGPVDLCRAVDTVRNSLHIRRRAKQLAGSVAGYPGPAEAAEIVLDLARAA